jgi:hypothetical protein
MTTDPLPVPDPAEPTAGSESVLKIAAAVAALATAGLTAWLQQADIPEETIATLTAAVVLVAGRMFPLLAPKLAAVRNDPLAIVATIVTAGLAWFLPQTDISNGAMSIIAAVLGIVASAAIPSVRDTLRVRMDRPASRGRRDLL